MARISSPIFNAASGKMGGVVLRNVQTVTGERAIDMSAYQPIVANPQTVAQMRNRVKMGSAAKLAGALSHSVSMRNLYTLSIGNKTQFNWYVKGFMREEKVIAVVQGPDYPLGGIAGTGLQASGLSIAEAPIRYTQGRLSFVQMGVSLLSYRVFPTGGEISMDLVWDSTLGEKDQSTDVLVMWIIDVQTGSVYTEPLGAVRGDAAYSVSTAEIPLLIETESYKIGGFSFFRENLNGSFDSQISYPAFWVGNGDNLAILPPVDETAYYTSPTVVPPPPPIWGS